VLRRNKRRAVRETLTRAARFAWMDVPDTFEIVRHSEG